MEFKVGDKVKLVSMNNEGPWYKKYLGRIFTIKDLALNVAYLEEKTKENITPYLYNLEKVQDVYTYEKLKKSPIGTKITFEDGNVLVKDEENYFENIHNCRDISNLYNLKDNYSDLGKIIKIEEPTYTTVYEAKKEILDDAEKRYLKQVIRPYNKVISLQKYAPSNIKLAIIKITVSKIGGGIWTIDLPPFEKNTMYKNMEDNKEYTLEELGLKE